MDSVSKRCVLGKSRNEIGCLAYREWERSMPPMVDVDSVEERGVTISSAGKGWGSGSGEWPAADAKRECEASAHGRICLRLLRCPCGGLVCVSHGNCSQCARGVPVRDGVLQLFVADDSFYEGRYTAQTKLSEERIRSLAIRSLLPFVNYGYLSRCLEAIPRGGVVVELGAGGGVRLFGQRFRAVAVDLSQASLAAVPVEYAGRIRGNATSLDIAPGSCDAVVSSCFFEHMATGKKEALLAAIASWLRPRGRIVMLFDTLSESPPMKRLRRSPELFEQCFIQHDGHVGLESVQANLDWFERAGFVLEEGIGLNRLLQHLPVLQWVEPYEDVIWGMGFLARGARAVSDRPVLNRLYTGGVHLFDLTLGRALPTSWSRLYLGTWRKTA
jgi:SAM-dependent methyltransferase